MVLAGAAGIDSSWVTFATDCLGHLIGFPVIFVAFWKTSCEFLDRNAPWREGRIFHFLPLNFIRQDPDATDEARAAYAFSRFMGKPLSVPYATFRSTVRTANGSYAALEVLTVSMIAVAVLVPTIFIFKAWPDSSNGKILLNFENGRSGSQVIGVFVGGWLSLRIISKFLRKWALRNSDMDAMRASVDALYACRNLVLGRGELLSVERSVARLSIELSWFAASGGGFIDAKKRQDLWNHVALVQKRLLGSTENLFINGASSIPEVVEQVTFVTSRMCEQRWLSLLDVADTGEGGAPTETGARGDRRDAWVVLGGSLAAAVGLGAAAAAGLPLTAALPAALILVLGPATLWGSNRLNMSPASLLRSMSGSLGNSTQGEAGVPHPGGQSVEGDSATDPTGHNSAS